MNYKMISYILGWILIFEGMFLAVPGITALFFGESALWSYLLSISICLLIGSLLILKKPQKRQLYAREGCVIVSLSWIVLSAFGALPFFLSGEIPNYVDALFESVSGFTTTGASILNDVEAISYASRMWRSFSHWVGGMGVLVFIMAFIPLSGGQNMHILKAESPGPSVSKLVPRVKTTAMLLYSIYLVLTLIEFILLLCGGMTPYEAINTAFATGGTGGFGFYNSSMGSFSPYIQIVVTVFMLLFSVNFNCYFLLMTRKIKDAFNLELRTFLIMYISATALITLNIAGSFKSAGEALRNSAFTVASIMSTTGFSVVDFNQWPEISRTLLVILMFIGSCAGSTCGGIKISRVIILFKGMAKELHTMIQPHQVKKIKMDSHTIDHETVRSVNVFMVAYLMIFIISLVIISFDNHDLITSFTAVATTINNVGPGLEMVGPSSNFSFFSDPAKIVLIFDMLAGRLELFPMLLLFTPATWKK